MPASGPVYQPTTVSYEQQNEWSRPGSYLSQTMSNSMRGPRCIQWLLLALGIFSVSAGIIMVVEGNVDFTGTHKHELEDEKGNIITPGSSTTDLVITITGVLLIILGILFLGVYVRLIRRRKGCPFFPTKEQRLARQLDTQVANGQILTLNPSTDLLVAAQYGPVSEIAYEPPKVSEEEETRKLMANDNKECASEVVDKPTREPRRKSETVERYRNRNMKAPIAMQEEITPSLRSSFCSVYYDDSPTTSIRSSLLDHSYEPSESSWTEHTETVV